MLLLLLFACTAVTSGKNDSGYGYARAIPVASKDQNETSTDNWSTTDWQTNSTEKQLGGSYKDGGIIEHTS